MADRQPKGMDDICIAENNEWNQSDSLPINNWDRETRKNEPIAPGVGTCCAVMLGSKHSFSSLVSWYTTPEILASPK